MKTKRALILIILFLVDTGADDDETKKSPHSQKTSGVSLDVKTSFANNIFRLSGMELGHVLQIIDLKCPNALEQPELEHEAGSEEAEVEINVDAIDPRTFAELDRYVKEKMLARTTGEALDELDGSAKKQKR